MIQRITELPLYWTEENIEIHQFEVDVFVNITTAESARAWFSAFEEHSKITMPQTKGYKVKGKRVIFREARHCIHSKKVRKKQGNPDCLATIHLRLRKNITLFRLRLCGFYQ